MSKVQLLKALVNQRLTAAADEIFELFEKTIAEYEEELCRSKEEKKRQHKLRDAAFNPEVRLHRLEVQQLVVSQDEVSPEQQELSPRLDQNDPPNSPQIKDERKELWGRQEGELQGEEEFDISMLRFKRIPVKREEEDGETLQSSQLHENQTVESRDTEHLKMEAGGEDCGGPEPDNHLQPVTPDKTSVTHSGDWEESDDPQEGLNPLQKKYIPVTSDNTSHSESKNDDTRCDLEGARDPQEGLNPLQNKDVPVSDMVCNTGKISVSSSECATSFRQKKLQKQKRIQKGVKPLNCKEFSGSLSGKIFSREKPFSCSVCSKRFAWNKNLRSHLVVHTGEKQFSCSVCSKRFAWNKDLKRHLVVHTGEKPFSCSVCLKKFSQLSYARRHRLVCERRKNLNA